jgi:pimeloyl-ACP methyl ester carboxylesterase
MKSLNAVCHDIPSGTGLLRAYVKGQGSPLILVHSINAAASSAEVRPVFDLMSLNHTVYAIDLPGYGASERTDRKYTPRLMTDAVLDLAAYVQRLHGNKGIDALAASLSCEFLARAAVQKPEYFNSLSLVSPTGLSGLKNRLAPEGQTYGQDWLWALLKGPGWGKTIFMALTRPKVIRYFLRKTWGSKQIDEEMFQHALWNARQIGAEHAPLCFLSAQMFSSDITRIYDQLSMPVWMSHGVRGDFVDYRGKERYSKLAQWRFRIYESGALPYFEMPEFFCADLKQFINASKHSTSPS